jgi:hypothetical protein
VTRDVRLSDALDAARHEFEYRDGVLSVRIPLAVVPTTTEHLGEPTV